jgi:hypothetical protein
MFLLIIVLAIAYGVGLGMAIAIWLMASEPCSDRRPPKEMIEGFELKKSA